MKKILLSLAAVAMLAACSKEETLVQQAPDAIGFDNAFVDNATRVDDKSLTNANLADFAVYGSVANGSNTALIFNNVLVNKTITNNDLTSDWKYQGTQYWIDGAKYNFAAVAPYKCGVADAFDIASKQTTLSFTNDGETDLLYAQSAEITGLDGNGDAADTANAPVAFTFRHTLSKVKFSFVNNYYATGSSIVVRDVVLTNPHKTATVVLDATNTTWSDLAVYTPAEGEDPFVIDFGDTENTTGVAATSIAQGTEWESENARFIIPSSADYPYVVSFVVDIYYGDTLIKTYYHTATVTFAPAVGSAYDIKTIITAANIDPDKAQEPIEFTVNTIPDWATPANQDAVIN